MIRWISSVCVLCVALANEGGERMILGVTDKIPRQVVGTTAFNIPEKTCGGIFERIHIKVSFEEIDQPMGRVLVFTIPSRPIGRAIEYKGRYSMRVGEVLIAGTKIRKGDRLRWDNEIESQRR